jgi:transcriptional regulator with XRE-family HTH domain
MSTTIGQTIKRLRLSRMLTQQDLANMLNLSPKTISKWETDVGIPNLPYIVPLAQALGTTTDELLRGTAVVENEPTENPSVQTFTKILDAYGIKVELKLIQTGGREMSEKIDYRRIADEIRKILPGEVISERVSTVTRSSGSDKYALNGESWIIENPTLEDIALMVEGLFAPGNYYAILLPNSAVVPTEEFIGNCAYVQVAVLDDDNANRGEGKYAVEAQFIYDWDKMKGVQSDFKQRQYRLGTDDVGEVKEIFQAFASGIVPDVTDWKDLTEKLFPRQ